MKDFENAGYKKFLQPPETIRSADFGLQKLFSDTTGKKYYVTIYCYDNSQFIGAHPNLTPFGFMPEVQFQSEDFRLSARNITLIINEETSVEYIEQDFEELWDFLGKPYYEKFNENS